MSVPVWPPISILKRTSPPNYVDADVVMANIVNEILASRIGEIRIGNFVTVATDKFRSRYTGSTLYTNEQLAEVFRGRLKAAVPPKPRLYWVP